MEQVTGYDYRADIWSLGITALELAKGYAPYAKYPPMKVLLLTIQQPPPSLDTYDGGNSYDYSEMFKNVIKICLVKDPSQRPNCKQVLEHRIFQGYTESLEQHRAKFKQELLDQIPDVGMEHGSVLEVVFYIFLDLFSVSIVVTFLFSPILYITSTKRYHTPMPGSTPIYANLTEEMHKKSPGISWVFSDGSQVFSSNSSGIDDDHFFDEFERQTGGEAFSAQRRLGEATVLETDKTINASNKECNKEKDEMEDFFDEFEKSTGGEHFRKAV